MIGVQRWDLSDPHIFVPCRVWNPERCEGPFPPKDRLGRPAVPPLCQACAQLRLKHLEEVWGEG